MFGNIANFFRKKIFAMEAMKHGGFRNVKVIKSERSFKGFNHSNTIDILIKDLNNSDFKENLNTIIDFKFFSPNQKSRFCAMLVKLASGSDLFMKEKRQIIRYWEKTFYVKKPNRHFKRDLTWMRGHQGFTSDEWDRKHVLLLPTERFKDEFKTLNP